MPTFREKQLVEEFVVESNIKEKEWLFTYEPEVKGLKFVGRGKNKSEAFDFIIKTFGKRIKKLQLKIVKVEKIK